MYPNSALSAWQLAIIAVVPVMALAAWLTAIYLAARDTGGHKQAAADTNCRDLLTFRRLVCRASRYIEAASPTVTTRRAGLVFLASIVTLLTKHRLGRTTPLWGILDNW